MNTWAMGLPKFCWNSFFRPARHEHEPHISTYPTQQLAACRKMHHVAVLGDVVLERIAANRVDCCDCGKHEQPNPVSRKRQRGCRLVRASMLPVSGFLMLCASSHTSTSSSSSARCASSASCSALCCSSGDCMQMRLVAAWLSNQIARRAALCEQAEGLVPHHHDACPRIRR